MFNRYFLLFPVLFLPTISLFNHMCIETERDRRDTLVLFKYLMLQLYLLCFVHFFFFVSGGRIRCFCTALG